MREMRLPGLLDGRMQPRTSRTDERHRLCNTNLKQWAKDAMKKFMKDAKIKSCNACHTKLAPKYELKKDAFDQFKKAGGK